MRPWDLSPIIGLFQTTAAKVVILCMRLLPIGVLGGKGCSLPFPRRVFAPWLAGMYLCDYLQPSETFECPPIQKFSSWKTRANMMAEARLQHTYKQALQYYKMIPKQNMTSNQISLSSNRSSSPNSCNGSMNNENENCPYVLEAITDLVELGSTAKDIISLIAQDLGSATGELALFMVSKCLSAGDQ
ncbi:hypothetical protein JHK84_043607 [Glycine max]|nr:hypothetical protein JHK84_043607 [Glycine max]